MTKTRNKTNFSFLILTAAILFFFLLPVFVAATGEYTVLAPLPGIGDDSGGKTTLTEYLTAIFNLTISVSVVLAFVMITFGGIVYATSDALSGKSKGREWVQNAIVGLLIVIGAWVILNTINPQILDFKLLIPGAKMENSGAGGVTGEGGGVTPGYVMTEEQIARDAFVRMGLAPLKVNWPNPCTDGQTLGCTNLNDLPSGTINSLKSLRVVCDCEMVITGGTEGGHREHGPGKAVVDLRDNPKLSDWIEKNMSHDGFVRWEGGSGKFTFEGAGEGRSTGAHWHVVLGQ